MKFKINNINVNKILMALTLSFSLFLPFVSNAASGLVPCGYNSGSANQTNAPLQNPCTLNDLYVLMARITNYLIMFAGLYAVLRIIMHSVALVTAAGNQEQISSGTKGLQNAVIGLALVFCAYLLVNTIFGIFGPTIGTGQSGFLYNPFK